MLGDGRSDLGNVDWGDTISRVLSGSSLGREGAAAVMREIMSGSSSDAQAAGILVAYAARPPLAEELAGMAEAMLEAAVKPALGSGLLDTCGTGGDRSGSINASTMAAFIAAGAGAKVAKHGNRAASSKCGSADLLEAMGVVIDLGPKGVTHCMEEAGMCFLFARRYHPAMKNVAGVRQELGIRTFMNFLGPLCNPAGAELHAMGVADPSLADLLVETMRLLGRKRALLLHGLDGLDEVSVSAPTRIWELAEDEVRTYEIDPEKLGLGPVPTGAVTGGTPEENKRIVEEVLAGAENAHARFAVANGAAALVAAELAADFNEGVEMAWETLRSGKAARAAERLADASRNAPDSDVSAHQS